MNTRGWIRHPLSIVLIAGAALAPLLSACQPAPTSTSLPPTPPTVTAPPAPTLTPPSETPPAVTEPASNASGEISLNVSGVAQDWTVETVAAVPASTGRPFWEVAPQHRRVTLPGYAVADHSKTPQIFIYPVADLAGFNQAAGQMAVDLQALLQARQPVKRMPFLPLFNEAQVMHAQVQYLDFKNGSGVRFLTQFAQAPMPINNLGLIYTFQGLTADGRFYVAAVLPVTHPELPASAQPGVELNDFPTYLAETVAWLDQPPGVGFTPDLVQLDALVQSLEVK